MKDPEETNISKDPLELKFGGREILDATISGIYDKGQGKLSLNTLLTSTKIIQFKSNKSREAFSLVARSIIEGCRWQIRQEIEQVQIDENNRFYYQKREINHHAFQQLKDKEYQLHIKDLKKPDKLPLLEDFKKYYYEWLKETFDMADTRARSIAAEFPYFFGYALFEELRRGRYNELNKWIYDPTIEQQSRLMYRQRYRAELRLEYNCAVLGEPDVALPDVYIEPGFLILDKLLPQEQRDNLRFKKSVPIQEHFIPTEYKNSIHHYFNECFINARQSSAINIELETSRMLILFGQPGHGKTSFCFRTAYDLLDRPEFSGEVFMVRLRDADREVVLNPRKELSTLLPEQLGASSFWEDGSTTTLLLLDGLDELYMSQGLSDNEVHEFLLGCRRMLNKYKNLFIVITSRFNYIETSRLDNIDALILSLATLNVDQQKELVKRFVAQRSEPISIDPGFLDFVNKDRMYDHIRELIELPILLQMILISGIDLESVDSRAKVYQHLFKAVLDRKWAKDGRLLKYKKDNFKPEDLRFYLAFLAFKIYQSDRNYLIRNEIEGFKETKAFIQKFLTNEITQEEFGKILKDVLTSFYLKERRKDQDDDSEEGDKYHYAIEFLHKSLYEYLCCEYIWSKTKELFLEPNGQPQYHDFDDVGEDLQRFFSHTRLTDETLDYLYEIMDADTGCHKSLQEAMNFSLPSLLKHGFIYQYPLHNDKIPQKYPPDQQALHIFHGYWAIFGHLRYYEIKFGAFFDTGWQEFMRGQRSLIDEQTCVNQFREECSSLIRYESNSPFSKITFFQKLEDEIVNFPKWLKTLLAEGEISQQPNFQNWLRRHQFVHSNQDLRPAFLEEETAITLNMFLRYLRQIGTDRLSTRIKLSLAALKDVDLTNFLSPGLVAPGANLHYAHLRGVDLRGANLKGVNFNGAYLRSAFLSGTSFRYASLRSAYLIGADLSGADLRDADLNSAILHRADLRGAFLRGAQLFYATLGGANLSEADLRDTSFRDADLRGADLHFADLFNADFSGADLYGVSLEGACVLQPNWLETLEVDHKDWLLNMFKVNPEKQILKRIDGELEGYMIEKRGSGI
ncbi:MAG: pentapeptide repeat-containing protein [Lewinellaceae bacterium]|nr:pentapeptide repeat-containing protein [Lewinellaceae bacterium]